MKKKKGHTATGLLAQGRSGLSPHKRESPKKKKNRKTSIGGGNTKRKRKGAGDWTG